MRVLVIVDVSNLYYSVAAQFRGAKLDYEKLMRTCQGFGEVYRALAYGAAMGNEADRFKRVLRDCGFEPKYKEPKVYPGKTPDHEYRKADWDVGMAMDIVRMIDHVDLVILCTGDGDLAPCLEWVDFKGKRSVVIGCGISRDLKNACYQWIEISGDLIEIPNTDSSVGVRAGGSGHAVEPLNG